MQYASPVRNTLRIVGANLYTACADAPASQPAGRIENGAVVLRDREIIWVGPSDSAPAADTTIDARGRLVTPGWIDCHTHLVFANDRSADYRRRSAGMSYREIAAAGGGILSTVRATRIAGEDELVAGALPRLRRFLEHGVTTIEAKSGYGLDTAAELKLLRVLRSLSALQPVEIEPTFLGAHAIPPEDREAPDRYVDRVVSEMIPEVAAAGLARFCDVFVEGGFFTLAQGRRVLEAAAARGMATKIHADQLSSGGGAELAAELGACSADHLDHASDAGLEAMAKSGTVAVLLPAAAMFLGDAPFRADRFRKAGVRIALSTDCNPGTCPTEDLGLVTTLGMSSLKLTPEESLLAVTAHAAAAIARTDVGELRTGKQGDVVVWDAPTLEHLPWHLGVPHAAVVVKAGRVVLERDAAPACRP